MKGKMIKINFPKKRLLILLSSLAVCFAATSIFFQALKYFVEMGVVLRAPLNVGRCPPVSSDALWLDLEVHGLEQEPRGAISGPNTGVTHTNEKLMRRERCMIDDTVATYVACKSLNNKICVVSIIAGPPGGPYHQKVL